MRERERERERESQRERQRERERDREKQRECGIVDRITTSRAFVIVTVCTIGLFLLN